MGGAAEPCKGRNASGGLATTINLLRAELSALALKGKFIGGGGFARARLSPRF